MRNRILTLLLLVTILMGCQQNTKKGRTINVLPAGVGTYLSSYSEQSIDINEELYFRLSGSVISSDKIGEVVTGEVFSINPSVPGRAHWSDSATLVFKSDEPLDYDRDYRITINLESLYPEISEEYKTIEIDYHTKPLDIQFRINEIQYGNTVTNEQLSVSGYLKTNSPITQEKIRDILKAQQKGNKDLVVNWDYHNKKRHGFTIQNILRNKKESELLITWSGKALGTDAKGEHKMSILPVGEFKLVNAEIDKENNETIVLAFSDQLDRSQDLIGLVTITGYQGVLRIDKAGSKLKVHPSPKPHSPFTINISEHIKRRDGDKLNQVTDRQLSYEPLKPTLKLLGKGVIVPEGDQIIFPFTASNISSATVEIYKIFQDNVLQYLQYGMMTQNGNRHTVGRVVHREKIQLVDYLDNEDAQTLRIALDLNDFIKVDPGAIYQVRVGFDQTDVTNYECSSEEEEKFEFNLEDHQSILDYRQLNWSKMEDPCSDSYYNSNRYINRNILASNLGLIAKYGKDKQCHIAVSELTSLQPISGVELKIYDFQQQLIATTNSDGNGLAAIELSRTPAFIIAQNSQEYGYVNMVDAHALSLSEFNVSGKTKNKGLDGMIYGERGVWRPGDTLFLNFVLEDPTGSLPADHPIKFELRDSRSNVRFTKTTSRHLGHIYHFPIPTRTNDPTGNWIATATIGGQKFSKTIKIETVKPNRLKIDFDIPHDKLHLTEDTPLTVKATWLHGAKANNLKVKMDIQLSASTTQFDGYNSYVFDDPARKIDGLPQNILNDQLNGQGEKTFSIKPYDTWQPAGKVKANLKTRVFEKSGNYSEDNLTVDADIYNNYVGINLPKSRWGRSYLSNDGSSKIKFVSVDRDGKVASNRKINIGIYEARWNWWYDRSNTGKYNYNTGTHRGAILKDNITTNTKGEAEYTVELEKDWGNYMIRICDEESGHCTGGLFYAGDYWTKSQEQQGPQLLNFSADKTEYKVGENIKLKIPSNKGAKIFLSMETGAGVEQAFWVESQGDLTEIEIPCTSEMSPTLYINATLIQPHANKENDLPLRMYGIIPIKVIDPYTTLSPMVVVPSKVRPDQDFEITVSESKGEEMYYTLAVVDEGLLSLTRFQTPNIWSHFFAKQALGVKSWDIYDLVLGGYSTLMDKIISIGGDGANRNATKAAKANRFKPCAKHLSPFHVKANEQQTHKLRIDNYLGAVRVMVVARNGQRYGNTDKSVQVKKPLMVQTTLPRALGPGETLSIPANVFAMEDDIRSATVNISETGMLDFTSQTSQTLAFDSPGDKLSFFDTKVGDAVGPTKITVIAKSGKESSKETIEIEIRNPNPITTEVKDFVIPADGQQTFPIEYFGTPGTNSTHLEVSNSLPINLQQRIDYLIGYPYGCIEQTTSKLFPQLYLNDLTDLNSQQINEIEKNIRKGIERLSLFQISSGAMSYWPGDSSPSSWGSIYVFHFLLEAKEKGHHIPRDMLEPLAKYLNKESSTYSNDRYPYYNRGVGQAYRLYVLAKYGTPHLGSMNRMRQTKDLTTTSRHLLAAAYAYVGKKEVSRELLNNISLEVKPYRETGYSYGSELRDQAIILDARMAIDNIQDNLGLAKRISNDLSSRRWYSTQSTAFALLSLSKYTAEQSKGQLTYTWNYDGQSQEVSTDKSLSKIHLQEANSGKSVVVVNRSGGNLYARLLISGQEPPGKEGPAQSKHIDMKITYLDLEGKKLDISKLKQGTDFKVVTKITNLGTRGRNIEELALNQIFPSGWEIQNQRMSGVTDLTPESKYEYRDIRDDRVNTFFDIEGRDTHTYITYVTATYAGKFYLPSTLVEAMYDNEIQAKTQGQWVEVKR